MSFTRNVMWLQASLLVTQVFAVAVSVLFFHRLGDALYGLYGGLFIVFNSYGILFYFDPGNVLIQRLAAARDANDRKDLARTGLTIGIASALTWSLALWLTSRLITLLWMDNAILADAVAWTALLPLTNAPLQWALNVIQGASDMKRAAGILILQNLTRPVGALAGLWWVAPGLVPVPGEESAALTAMILGVTIAQAASWGPALLSVRHHAPGLLSHLRPKAPPRKLVTDSLMLSVDKKVSDQFDLVPRQMIGNIFAARPEMLGWYDIVAKIFGLAQSVVSPLSRALLPNLSKDETDPHRIRGKVRRLTRISLPVGALIGLGGWAGTRWILLPHVYDITGGPAEAIAASVGFMMVLFPTFGWGIVNSTLALVLDKIKLLFKLKLWMTLLLFPLAWWLISLWGLVGAGAWVLIQRGSIRFAASVILGRELNSRCKA